MDQCKISVRKLGLLRNTYNLINMPAISDASGYTLSKLELDTLFMSILENLYDTQSTLFPAYVGEREHIREQYLF